jgi:hypothetical protein
MKTCAKCGIEKPLDEFYKDKTVKDGHRNKCKSCILECNKKWYLENPERVKALKKKWYLENTEKVRAYDKKWCLENSEKEKKRHKKWCLENPEKLIYSKTKSKLKKQIGETPPPELVEVKLLINKTKRLCKTLKN